MLYAWRNLERVPSLKLNSLVARLDFQPSLEHIEELSSPVVGVLYLAKPGGDTLLDHAQVGRVQEAPAVAAGSPRVVFSIFYVDGSRFVLA